MRNLEAIAARRRAGSFAIGSALLLGLAAWATPGRVQAQTSSSAPPVPSQAGPSGYLWGALVRATDRSANLAGKTLESGLAERLGQAFPFQHFQLIGEHTQPLSAEYETWIMPSEELFMKVDSKGPVEGGLGLHLQLWRRENVVLKTDVILSSGSPVIITGPKWGADQLLFVVQLKEQP